MPNPAEIGPGLLEALRQAYGGPTPRPPWTFPAIAALCLPEQRVGPVLAALVEAGLTDPAALAATSPTELASLLREAGVTRPDRHVGLLLRLAEWTSRRAGSLETAPTEALREELRNVRGIGPATADAILLFALHRPAYPLDRASYRIFVRHGWIDPTAEYDEARDVAERLAGPDPESLTTLAFGLETIGADYCRVRQARCERCPLRPFLPEGGPIEGD